MNPIKYAFRHAPILFTANVLVVLSIPLALYDPPTYMSASALAMGGMAIINTFYTMWRFG